ncbi:general stress protein [Paenibacillus sp. HB172176]|uniref:general stress protein n=1 Tax=Paenibacillus sp. HB172176 TaxID=2493690 RepID=UPI00143950AF|nr:general stress protein [Paenibacillus sp. HB172176]
MARKLGVFDSQQHVIDAIEKLEKAGIKQGDIQVLAKDFEHSRRIESESDVHVDEVREVEEASEHSAAPDSGDQARFAGIGAAAMSGSYGMNGNGGVAGAGAAFSYAPAFVFFGSDDDHENTLHAFGLDDKEAELCGKAISEGNLVMVVETDESKSLLDKDGGPDLSALGVAEAVFRDCGATTIADGS